MKNVQNRDVPSAGLGKNVDPLEGSPDERWSQASALCVPHLCKLNTRLQTELAAGRSRRSERHQLNFQQLEMLEAELSNQGILNRSAHTGAGEEQYSLAQHAQYEASLWSWRAERFGVDAELLSFEVDLERYLVAFAAELLTALAADAGGSIRANSTYSRPGVWHRAADSKRSALAQLHYLEQIAAFLNGAFENTSNRYQRGLNVVLRALISAAKASYSAALAADDQQLLVLPLSKQEFFRRLKEFRINTNPLGA